MRKQFKVLALIRVSRIEILILKIFADTVDLKEFSAVVKSMEKATRLQVDSITAAFKTLGPVLNSNYFRKMLSNSGMKFNDKEMAGILEDTLLLPAGQNTVNYEGMEFQQTLN